MVSRRNRHPTHPLNAMLTYAVLESQVRIATVNPRVGSNDRLPARLPSWACVASLRSDGVTTLAGGPLGVVLRVLAYLRSERLCSQYKRCLSAASAACQADGAVSLERYSGSRRSSVVATTAYMPG
jgi:hypothetical protein